MTGSARTRGRFASPIRKNGSGFGIAVSSADIRKHKTAKKITRFSQNFLLVNM